MDVRSLSDVFQQCSTPRNYNLILCAKINNFCFIFRERVEGKRVLNACFAKKRPRGIQMASFCTELGFFSNAAFKCVRRMNI